MIADGTDGGVSKGGNSDAPTTTARRLAAGRQTVDDVRYPHRKTTKYGRFFYAEERR